MVRPGCYTDGGRREPRARRQSRPAQSPSCPRLMSGCGASGERVDLGGDGDRVLHRAEVRELRQGDGPTVGKGTRNDRAELPRRVVLGAARQHQHRAPHLAQVIEQVLLGAALEDARLVLGFALELDGAVRPVDEAVVDVGAECLGRERRPAGACRRSCRRPRPGRRTPCAGGGRLRSCGDGPSVRRGSCGKAMGSNRTRPANVPGRASSAMSRAAPPSECPKPKALLEARARRRRRRRRPPKRLQSPMSVGGSSESTRAPGSPGTSSGTRAPTARRGARRRSRGTRWRGTAAGPGPRLPGRGARGRRRRPRSGAGCWGPSPDDRRRHGGRARSGL